MQLLWSESPAISASRSALAIMALSTRQCFGRTSFGRSAYRILAKDGQNLRSVCTYLEHLRSRIRGEHFAGAYEQG